MRRFDMVLPTSVEECLRTLAERGPDASVVAGGTDLLPQLKNGMLQTGLRGRPVRREPSCAPARRAPTGPASGSARRSRRATLERDAARAGRLSGHRRERRAGRLGPGAQPRDARRQPLQRRALGRHGAAAPGARRRGGDRRAQGRAPRADRVVLPRRAPHRARRRTSCSSRSSCPHPGAAQRRQLPAAHAAPRARHRGGRAWRRSSRSPNGVCTKARIALAAVAPTPVRATAAEQALEGQPVTPELIERAADAGGRGRAPDQRPARLRRVPPSPRPGPDPPHAHHGARARERLTIPEGAITWRSRS